MGLYKNSERDEKFIPKHLTADPGFHVQQPQPNSPPTTPTTRTNSIYYKEKREKRAIYERRVLKGLHVRDGSERRVIGERSAAAAAAAVVVAAAAVVVVVEDAAAAGKAAAVVVVVVVEMEIGVVVVAEKVAAVDEETAVVAADGDRGLGPDWVGIGFGY